MGLLSQTLDAARKALDMSREARTGVGGATVGAGFLAAPQESEAAPMGTLARLARMRTREAWHGSPHTYDQVDLSHLGTGEGAQAYGHGFYAADSRRVAEDYRQTLSKGVTATFDGEPVRRADLNAVNAGGRRTHENFALRQLIDSDGDVDAARAILDGFASDPDWGRAFRKAADSLDDIAARTEITRSDALYRLEIPDENLLDWDAPLSEQPEGVQRAYADAVDRMRRWDARRFAEEEIPMDFGLAANLPDNPSGAQIYDEVGRSPQRGMTADQETASRLLSEAGVPGIRYLDGQSRNAGEGTRNYVIFDDTNVNVVERNGRPVDAPPRGRAGGVVGPARAAAAALAAGTAGAAQANTVGSVTNVPPMYAPSAAQRERAIRAEQERLLREHARASQGDTIEAPRYPWLAAAADWAGSQQLPGVPLYDQPLAGTAETLNRLAYGDYRPGGHGLGTLAMDSLMTGLELVDPGTWAAVAAPEPRRMSPAEAAAERFSTARRGKRSAYKASVRKDP